MIRDVNQLFQAFLRDKTALIGEPMEVLAAIIHRARPSIGRWNPDGPLEITTDFVLDRTRDLLLKNSPVSEILPELVALDRLLTSDEGLTLKSLEPRAFYRLETCSELLHAAARLSSDAQMDAKLEEVRRIRSS